jgi:hypothetical protein
MLLSVNTLMSICTSVSFIGTDDVSLYDLCRLSGRDAEQANRGLPPKQAMWLYVSTLDEKLSRDLFCSMKKIHSSASINVEALRKLVKVGTKHYLYILL